MSSKKDKSIDPSLVQAGISSLNERFELARKMNLGLPSDIRARFEQFRKMVQYLPPERDLLMALRSLEELGRIHGGKPSVGNTRDDGSEARSRNHHQGLSQEPVGQNDDQMLSITESTYPQDSQAQNGGDTPILDTTNFKWVKIGGRRRRLSLIRSMIVEHLWQTKIDEGDEYVSQHEVLKKAESRARCLKNAFRHHRDLHDALIEQSPDDPDLVRLKAGVRSSVQLSK